MTRVLPLLFCFISFWANAQVKSDSLSQTEGDSLITQSRDTVLLKTYAARYSPRKALLYAAILPGLGQVYTKKYWKLPLVYAGIISLGYGISFYQKGYVKYKEELFYNLENNVTQTPGGFTTDQLRTIVDKERRQRDFFVVLMAGMYLLQMIDAHVDAHLKEFDLNPKLQVRWEPMIQNDMVLGRQAGVSLMLKF